MFNGFLQKNIQQAEEKKQRQLKVSLKRMKQEAVRRENSSKKVKEKVAMWKNQNSRFLDTIKTGTIGFNTSRISQFREFQFPTCVKTSLPKRTVKSISPNYKPNPHQDFSFELSLRPRLKHKFLGPEKLQVH